MFIVFSVLYISYKFRLNLRDVNFFILCFLNIYLFFSLFCNRFLG